MGEFFAWLSGNSVATTVFLLSFSALFVAITLMYIVGFVQGRSISFWPPKIGPKPEPGATIQAHYGHTSLPPFDGPFFEKPLLISGSKKNRFRINSAFLHLDQCTIMLWVLVSPKGKGLRDSPSNRYLLAHNTGQADAEAHTYYNQFCLRHTDGARWDVTFSDDKASYTSSPLRIADGIETGWHHFLIAWNRSTPEIKFLIDGGRSGSDRSTSFAGWPERLADSATVGAWTSDWEGHYCETKLNNLVIFDRFLTIKDKVVTRHLTEKPHEI